jgi:hypothetical protein
MRVIEDVCVCDKGRSGDQELSENQISVVVVVMRAVFIFAVQIQPIFKEGALCCSICVGPDERRRKKALDPKSKSERAGSKERQLKPR